MLPSTEADEAKRDEGKPILSPMRSNSENSDSESLGYFNFARLFTDLINTERNPDSPEKVKITRLDAFFLLSNAMIGAGVLMQSAVIEKSGLIAGIVLFFIVSIFTFVGVRTLTNLADASGVSEYGEIAYKAYGPIGSLVVDVSIVIFNFTTVMSYIMYLGILSSDIVVGYFPDSDTWYTSTSFFATILTFIVVLPICLVRNFGNLTIVAYFSIVMMVMVTFIIIIDGSIITTPASWSSLNLVSFSGSAIQLCNLVYSLGFAPAVLYVYAALDPKYKRSMSNVNFSAVFFGATLCLTIGIAGYVLFGSQTSINIIDDLSDAAKRVCDIGMIAHFALFLPGDFFVMRASLYHLTQCGSTGRYTAAEKRPALRSIQELDDLTYFLYTAAVLSTILFMAVMVNMFGGGMNGTTFSTVIGIIGGLAGSVDTFIMPGMCGLVFFQPNTNQYYESIWLIVGGVICVVVIAIGSILSILQAL